MVGCAAMEALDPRVQAVLALDPELSQLVREVDRSLIRWSLERAPLERLRAATRSLHGLRRFQRGTSKGS
jgi:hypothetical protein